jgi:hypothetical protein
VNNYYLPTDIVNVASVQKSEHNRIVEDVEEPYQGTQSEQEDGKQEICDRIQLNIDELSSEPLLLCLLALRRLTHFWSCDAIVLKMIIEAMLNIRYSRR